MSEIAVRSASGLILVLAILGALFLGNPVWAILCSAIALVSLFEYYSMLSRSYHVSGGIGYGAGALILLLTSTGGNERVIVPVLAFSVFLVFLVEIVRRHMTGASDIARNAGGTIAGLLYVVLPWGFLIMLRELPWGLYLLATLFTCTWCADVGAYLTGSTWGKTPLCPAVSPKKTFEGFLGGLAGALLCGGALSYLWNTRPLPVLLIALACGTFGQMGDLAESLLKRETGVKDSGTIIPGHGGMLDRFDSILISSVLVFLAFGVW